ncbi:phosphoglycolate phosphatase [Palleronia aestuarii]|uniref:phosphoglycolate phosphatase n=1 Tax=Palleronia aestuarii TaxID=568105 RepID=A0A2W7N0X8_9RHOB|nr:HAD-IA family hydrolase [Palleronia aestuarii]PZX10534.1 phosphoglycolate phosphatase [Palleronia aestuarii]
MSGELKAVIFDLDGTLIDSAPDIAAAVNRHLSETRWPTLDIDVIEGFIGFGPRRLITDVFAHIGHPNDDAAIDRALRAYLDNYRGDPAGRTRIFPKVREDLDVLAAAGLRLGLCTNKPHGMTGRVLDALGMADLFDAALGADAVENCKPHPDHLHAVAERMRLSPGEWVYVGDTGVDQAAARGAGVPFYVVPWGGGAAVSVAPEYRLTRLADLLALTRRAPS